MKRSFGILTIILLLCTAAFAQGQTEHARPTEKDKTEAIPANGVLKRGAAVSAAAERVALADALADPAKYDGKNVVVEGVIVRSCKNEGCWMELAPGEGKKSVRIRMKDHAFFIPLDSAGARARAEGVFSVKTLSKAEVDHLINDDGAKFDERNPDGSVTEVTFLASGVELTRKK